MNIETTKIIGLIFNLILRFKIMTNRETTKSNRTPILYNVSTLPNEPVIVGKEAKTKNKK